MGTHLDAPPANGLRRRIVLVAVVLLLLLFLGLGLLATGTTSFGVGRATSTGLTDKPNHVTSDAPPASSGLHCFADFAGDPLPPP